ncbi:hypothetical protein MNB_SV-10-517 [hydrothermal vent metagenome]|uniref:Uncharacterized protein n=1 Tax=hydrothermal vent metagenome TaxID=652676 RepID=A0A1W1BUU7_9ZZZZ
MIMTSTSVITVIDIHVTVYIAIHVSIDISVNVFIPVDVLVLHIGSIGWSVACLYTTVSAPLSGTSSRASSPVGRTSPCTAASSARTATPAASSCLSHTEKCDIEGNGECTVAVMDCLHIGSDTDRRGKNAYGCSHDCELD